MSEVNLSSAQRRYLKQLAHPLKPLMQMGKDGATPAFVKELGEQLGAHELIKVRVLNNCEFPKEDIEEPIRRAGITIVQKVGHVYTVFKQREEKSVINLPKS